jgi:tRNA(adenine34) deaminase
MPHFSLFQAHHLPIPGSEIVAPSKKKKWVQDVKTVSTFPPEKLFTKDAETIAKSLASKKVSPKGIGSGIKMLQYFINRSGKGLPASRKKVLEKAKRLMQEKAAETASSKNPRRRSERHRRSRRSAHAA